MAKPKNVSRAAKAAPGAPKLKTADKVARTFGDLTPEGRDFYRQRGDALNLDAAAAFELEARIIPELEAAGVNNAQLKAILAADDPYNAAQQVMAAERASLSEPLLSGGYGYTQQALDDLPLSQLKDTYSSIFNQSDAKPRPSGIRGQDPNASQTVETRVPDEKQTASTPTEMPEPPKGGNAKETPKQEQDALRSFLARGSEVFSDGRPAGGPGFFTQDMVGPAADFQSVSAPGGGIQRPTMIDVQSAPPRTPSMTDIEAAVRGVTPAKQAKRKPKPVGSLASMELDPSTTQVRVGDMPAPAQAAGGPIVVGQQFDPGMPAGLVDATQTRRPAQAAASPGVQPAPPQEVAPKVDAPPRPSITQTDPVLTGIQWMGGSMKRAPVAWGLGLGVPAAGLGYRFGLFGGSDEKQQPQQQSMQGLQPAVILSPEALREMESGRRLMQSPQMQQYQQQPPPPPPARPGPGQSTDLIRQMRMAREMA